MYENLSALTVKEKECIKKRACFSAEELAVFNNLCSQNNRKDNEGLMQQLNISKARLIAVKGQVFFKVFRAAALTLEDEIE